MALLDRGMLDENGELAKVNGATDPIGRKILARFLENYQGELANPTFFSNFQSPRFEADLFDLNEPAYQKLFTLFGKSQQYKDLVLRKHSILAKRERKADARAVASVTQATEPTFVATLSSSLNPTVKSVLTTDLTTDFKSQLVEQGLLQGLTPDSRSLLIPNRNNASMNTHFGGGILGSISYIFANNNLYQNPDGGLKSYRALVGSIGEDTLCRSLPWIRYGDANKYVRLSSVLPYRRAQSCSQCHASSDPAGAGLREIHFDKLSSLGTSFWNRSPVSKPSMPLPELEGDADFAFRPAEGTFYYRTSSGVLIHQGFTGVAGLGQIISGLDDYYICAAKRHYRLLTGIEVDLSDSGDPEATPLNEAEKVKRSLVIRLGLELKNHQSLRSLIQSIIERPEFALPGRGL